MAPSRNELPRRNIIYNACTHLMRGSFVERVKYHLKPRRLRWNWAQYRHKDSVTIIIGKQAKLRLYYDSLLAKLIYCDNFEASERDFTERFLRPGDTFVDIGANIGLFTVIGAERVGSAGQVFAFEPAMKTFDRLAENIGINNFANVQYHRLALSDAAIELPLNIASGGHDAWNSLAKPIAGRPCAVEHVACVRLDDLADAAILNGPVSLVKIDVEGWENKVLLGGQRFFSADNAPVLVMEFAEDAARSADSSCRELYDRLLSFGYQLFAYTCSTRQLDPQPYRETFVWSNLIACKHPALVRDRIHGD